VSLFCLSVALAQNTTGVTTATTMAAAGGNGPLAPHMRPCAPRRRVKWMGDNPPSLRMYCWGGVEGVYGPQSASGDDASPQNRSVLRAMHTPTAPKSISACLGGYRPSIQSVGAEQKVLSGALGGYFRRRQLWLAMVVMVDVGCWRHTSDRSTVGIVEIVYGSIFFSSYVDPIHFLTSDPAAKKERFRPSHFVV
jgi:hypothetical protein